MEYIHHVIRVGCWSSGRTEVVRGVGSGSKVSESEVWHDAMICSFLCSL
jgi:hypothetical protein